MPLKPVDPKLSEQSRRSGAKTRWDANRQAFAISTIPVQKLCQPCYDGIRSNQRPVSRVVHRPNSILRCEICKKVYSSGRQGRSKRKTA